VKATIVAGAALAALLLLGCSHSSSAAGKGTSVFKVKVGDCLVPPTAIKAEISTVTVVKCTQPHTQEVFAEVTYGSGPPGATTTSTSGTFPGANVLMTYANGACLQKFQAYIGIDYQDSNLYYTYMLPSARSWSSNDRTIVCLITTTGQQLTASVKGSHL
jgi:Septum formation